MLTSGATATPDLAAVIESVQVELGNWLDLIDGQGADYARRYATWIIEGAPRSGTPNRPADLHHKIAAAIRELVLDEAQIRHRVPARLGAGR